MDSQEPTLSPEEQNKVILIPDEWSDDRAYAIAKAGLDYMARFRNQNHERRFWESDKLFQGWTAQNTWEGTKIPRASMPVFMLFTEIMGILPSVVGALFPDSLPFQVKARPGSTPDAAKAVEQLLSFQLSDLGENEFEFKTMREVILRALTQELLYGNLIVEVGWAMQQRPGVQWERQLVPVRVPMFDPMSGQQVMVPNGQFRIETRRNDITEVINKPVARNIDIRDFFIDPNCPSTNVQEARMCATRHFWTIEELKGMAASDERIQLPDDAVLVELSKKKTATPADQSKQLTEVYRGNSWNPTQDQTDDAAMKRVEVIRYFQKNRHVWFIPGHPKPLYNQPGEGFYPFVTAGFAPVPNRWYAMSLADLVEGDQKLAQTILNSRLDELNLLIHPPIVRKRGSQIPLSQRRLRPGVEWEVNGDPSRDVIRMEMGNVTANAFIEYEALERRVQKTTGVTDLQMGVASTGGNSALRSATGVATQSNNTGRRMNHMVENIEDQVVVPTLTIMHTMNKRYLDPDSVIQLLGQDGQLIELDPLYIKNCNVQFQILASTKMRSRAMLQSGGAQAILGAVLNPGMSQLAAQAGMLPNFKGISQLVADTYQTSAMELWVPMNPQQQAAMNQPSPDKQAALAMQRERIEGQGELQASRDDTELMKLVADKVLDNHSLMKDATGHDPEPPPPPQKPAAKKK